jgi:hypothetical protein
MATVTHGSRKQCCCWYGTLHFAFFSLAGIISSSFFFFPVELLQEYSYFQNYSPCNPLVKILKKIDYSLNLMIYIEKREHVAFMGRKFLKYICN